MQLACSLKKPLFLHERDAHVEMVELLTRYREKLPACVIHCFTGTKEHALTYLNLGCYIGLTGYLWKDKSENGVRKILQDNVIPLDRLLVETDAPFMYPNTRASKLPQNIKDAMTERYAIIHSALKLEKSAISKVQKKHFLHFQKWQKINFCIRKKNPKIAFLVVLNFFLV